MYNCVKQCYPNKFKEKEKKRIADKVKLDKFTLFMPNFRVNKSCVDNFANISFRNILVNNINHSYVNS